MKQTEQKAQTNNQGQGYEATLKAQYAYAMSQKDPVHQVRELSNLKKTMAQMQEQVDGFGKGEVPLSRQYSRYTQGASVFYGATVVLTAVASAAVTCAIMTPFVAVSAGIAAVSGIAAAVCYKDSKGFERKATEVADRQVAENDGNDQFSSFCSRFTQKVNADIDSTIRSMKAADMTVSSQVLQTLCEASAVATNDTLQKQFNQKGRQQTTKPKAQNTAKPKPARKGKTLQA